MVLPVVNQEIWCSYYQYNVVVQNERVFLFTPVWDKLSTKKLKKYIVFTARPNKNYVAYVWRSHLWIFKTMRNSRDWNEGLLHPRSPYQGKLWFAKRNRLRMSRIGNTLDIRESGGHYKRHRHVEASSMLVGRGTCNTYCNRRQVRTGWVHQLRAEGFESSAYSSHTHYAQTIWFLFVTQGAILN